jgi:hypothetical protein
MPKSKRKAIKKILVSEHETLLEEVQEHVQDSSSWLETRRKEWDDLESMLIVSLDDDLSKTTRSKVYDPRLSTIVFERAARVMAQNPKGKAFAQSKDDIGKNMLMNLLLDYYAKNANEQFPFLVKLRIWDLYSLVYGSMFALVPWRVSEATNYIGPELLILPIRDCYPQPSIRNIDDSSWFDVRTVTSLEWLKQQDDGVWMNIDRLEADMKDDEGDAKTPNRDERESFVQRTYYPGAFGDVAFPKVELFTEYRHDSWITWTPQRVDSKTSRPYILRVVKEPYPDWKLPIVPKHAFPLIDSPIGLGEFARGKTLQYAINSLWNLYLDGVKYSIFPPLHINADNVVPSSIKWGAGEFWFMNNPNRDVQPMKLDPQGMNTFHSTFGALVAAVESQAGTTSISESANVQSALGKTPEAIKFIAKRESARDEWDRVMMEEAIKGVYERWISLNVSNMEANVEMRLFGEEIEDIKQHYPDVAEMFDSGKRGSVKFNKKHIDDRYDFVLEAGSTYKPNIEQEQNNITMVLKAVLENPPIIEALRAKNKEIDLAELFKRWMVAGGIKDWDKVIIETPVEKEKLPLPEEQEMPMPPEGQPMGPPTGPQAGPVAPMGPEMGMFKDAEIAAAAQQVIGGIPTGA